MCVEIISNYVVISKDDLYIAVQMKDVFGRSLPAAHQRRMDITVIITALFTKLKLHI